VNIPLSGSACQPRSPHITTAGSTSRRTSRSGPGVALDTDSAALTATPPPGAGPAVSSPYQGGGLRYLGLVDPLDGRTRLYYEMTQPDGSHALVTELR